MFTMIAMHPVTGLPVSIGPDNICDTKNDVFIWNPKQKLSLIILLTFVTLATISTLFDVLQRVYYMVMRDNNGNEGSEDLEDLREGSKVLAVALSFSILKNTKKLFHIREDREQTLSAVHGMRILSMVWIIIGHTYCFGGFYKILYTFKRISVDGIRNPARWEYQPLVNAFLLVDTFFFLG